MKARVVESSAYAATAYKTGWLSKYYPVEWAIACLTSNAGDTDKITATLSLAKKRGIEVKAPDINKSVEGFSLEVENGVKSIRYGLLAIKDVGRASVNYIAKIREEREFTSFDDFYARVHDKANIEKYSNKVNKNGKALCPVDKSCETALINTGVFDSFIANRYALMNHYMVNIKKIKDYEILNEKDFTRKAKLQIEKEILGSYISEHPLDPFPYQDLDNAEHNETIKTTGIVLKTTIKNTSKGGKYALTIIETKDGKERKIMLFGNTFTKYNEYLKKNNIVVVTGVYNKEYSNVNLKSLKLIVKKSKVLREDNDETGIINEASSESQSTQIRMPIKPDPSEELSPVDSVLMGQAF